MSVHRIQDERPVDVVRLVGRGMVATSAALTLTGIGAGVGAGTAVATPGHGGHESSGSRDGWSHDAGHLEDLEDEDAADCGAAGDDLVGGVLGDLGLGGSSGSDASADCDTSAADSGGSSSHGSSSPSSGGGNGTQQASPRPVSSNPDDIPPAPGETKIIDIPDRSAS